MASPTQPTLQKRSTILWEGGELPACVDAAELALIQSPTEIYQRGTLLVRPVVQSAMTVRGIRRPDGALTLIPVDGAWLTESLTRAAVWERKGQKTYERINCPRPVVDAYLARVGQWRVPVLTGIIEAPTLRPDGSILDIQGYDDQTGLLFRSSTRFTPIAHQPSRTDALAALAKLRDVIQGFPFSEPHDESVALSAILSGLIRRSIRSTPMHAFRAPKMASGKSLLADVVALIATGRRAAVIPPAPDTNEERKRVFAVLLAGDPIASVDNVEHVWNSDVMCSVLTQETYQDRILGASKTVTVPTSTFWMCTGNNLTFKGDLTTRVLPCDLDPQTERPEQRSFSQNLYEYIPEHRDELVNAALTILRAHHTAGRPRMGLKPYGRFEEWSDWVRTSLVWLDMPDPCLSIADMEDADPIRQHLRSLLAAWHAVFGDKAATVAEAIAQATYEGSDAQYQLMDALEEVAGEKGRINQRILGRFLSKYVRRIEGGFRLENAGTYKHATKWLVARIPNSPQQTLDFKDVSKRPESSVSFLSPPTRSQSILPNGEQVGTLQTPPIDRNPSPARVSSPVSFPPPVVSLPTEAHAPR